MPLHDMWVCRVADFKQQSTALWEKLAKQLDMYVEVGLPLGQAILGVKMMSNHSERGCD